MFIGHFAVGLGAKRVAPTVSLGFLFLSCQLADLLWPTFVLLGLEQVAIDPGNTVVTPLRFISYPYSHSLLALCGWGVLAGVLYLWLRHSTRAAAMTIGLVVISHWVLDAISHRPDVPLTLSGSTRVGLGLWNSMAATIGVEALMFVVGVALYLRATRARDRIGSIGFWSLIGFLLLVNVVNMTSPPPPSPTLVAWGAQAIWLLVIWAFWIDRHRMAR